MCYSKRSISEDRLMFLWPFSHTNTKRAYRLFHSCIYSFFICPTQKKSCFISVSLCVPPPSPQCTPLVFNGFYPPPTVPLCLLNSPSCSPSLYCLIATHVCLAKHREDRLVWGGLQCQSEQLWLKLLSSGLIQVLFMGGLYSVGQSVSVMTRGSEQELDTNMKAEHPEKASAVPTGSKNKVQTYVCRFHSTLNIWKTER